LNITVVIPTKNRPKDLGLAVQSILDQSRQPSELVVIDQSDDKTGNGLVHSLLLNTEISLIYIHDPKISGLVAAKCEAIRYVTGDLICFIEDDVILEFDYLAEIEAGFVGKSDMLGCCGVVVDVGPLPHGYVKFFHLFHRGIFVDPRVGVHGHFAGKGHALIPSSTLSGGLSAWRKEIFETVNFDIGNDFFMMEDIDFSTRAAATFGNRFFINPNARLEHLASPLNRARKPARERRKLREYLVFYKKRKSLPWAFPALVWLLLGLFLEAIVQSFRYGSPILVVNYFAGIVDGIHWKLRST
jgi:glycosyltransferase involved in cell wall biosynthesis